MNGPGDMKWCAVSKKRLLGPYFFKNVNVTGESYRNVLIHFAFPRSRYLQVYNLQQDGAPPHSLAV